MTAVETIDPEMMNRLCLETEARAHLRGWDQPPAFYVLYDATDETTRASYRMMSRLGSPIRVGRYAAREAVPAIAFRPNPTHSLFRMAINLAYSGHAAALVVAATLSQPGFLGVAFQCEGWLRAYESLEEYEQETRRLADIPGSVEERSVFGALVDGTDLMVVRRRGQEPKLASNLQGSLVESLRTIVAVVAELPLPPAPTAPNGWVWPT